MNSIVENKKENDDFKCSLCYAPMLSLGHLLQHIESDHKNESKVKSYNCPQCNKMYDIKENLIYHMNAYHYVKCSECQVIYNNENILSEHIRNDHLMECNICNYSAINPSVLDKHMRSMHPAEIVVICGVCAKSFTSEKECYAHIREHNNNSLVEALTFPCDQFPECNETFFNIKHLKDHKIKAHSKITSKYDDLEIKKEIKNIEDSIASIQNKIKSLTTELEKQNLKLVIIAKKVNKNSRPEINVITSSPDCVTKQPAKEMTKNVQHTAEVNKKVQNVIELDKNNDDENKSELPPKKAKMLIVGSSVTKNLHPQVLKHVTNCDITFSKAYTVDYEADAYYPEQNFVNVVPQELQCFRFALWAQRNFKYQYKCKLCGKYSYLEIKNGSNIKENS